MPARLRLLGPVSLPYSVYTFGAATGRSLLVTVCCLLTGALLAGCGSESAPSDKPPTTHTLVFVDQSVSTGAHPEAQSLFADSLAHIISQRMRRVGDRISLFYVHEETLSKAHHLDIQNDIPPPDNKQFRDEQALADAQHKQKTERFITQTTDRFQNALQSAPFSSSFTSWTDLWGTLGVASTVFSSTADRRVLYYFSDMFESMPGPKRRNFDRSPPTSRSQAEQWAQADADGLDSLMVINQSTLQKAEVRVLMGTLATKRQAQPVKFYWLALFQEVGLPRDQIHYN